MRTRIIFIIIGILLGTCYSQKTAEDWRAVIDATWGDGLPTEEKLQIFDDVYQSLDSEFGCFQGLNIDMDSLRDMYRPEISAGVSRGRFAAIMNYFVLAFKEGHNVIADTQLNFNNYQPPEPGVPLFAIGCWTDNSHFGATLTPLPDSTLLVIKTLPDHPLGLAPGDIVLGYDGVPWKRLYKDILAAQLPFFQEWLYPSNEKSFTHMMLKDAGMNWHLFDTLDVMKYGAEDTIHYPTSLLAGQSGNLSGSEQIKIPGVPFPDINWQGVYFLDVYDQENFVSWGIVENTNIGYIYVYSWVTAEQRPGSNVANQYHQAIDTLMNHYNVDGLILDTRFDFGYGDGTTERQGFSLLFNSQIETFALDQRCNSSNHLEMCPFNNYTSEKTMIIGDPHTLFDRPIAVLTGPGAFSAGDLIAFKLRFHPMVRTFGKPTSGLFSGTKILKDPSPGWQMFLAFANAYPLSDPGNYLSRAESQVDEEIWLTRDDVAKGEDTVVKRAIEWINNLAYAHDVAVNKSYVKPVSGIVEISAQVENPNAHDLSVLAYISLDDTTVIDSVYLAQNDDIWSAPWSTDEEDIYQVSVKTDDPDAGTSRTIPNVSRFTSSGPVVIDTIYVTGTDTIPNPGDPYIKYELFLKNEGTIDSIKNVTINPVFLDSCTQQAGFSLPVFGDLAPGETKQGSRPLGINFADSCQGGLIHFALEIKSNDFIFWTDTFQVDVVLGIKDDKSVLPQEYALHQNYPNPFNPSTTIEFDLPKPANVKIEVYTITGQKIQSLINKNLPAGNHQVEFNAENFSSGVYFYRIEAGEFQDVKKMILLR